MKPAKHILSLPSTPFYLLIFYIFPCKSICQITYPDYWPDIMNVNTFSENDISFLNIKSISIYYNLINIDSIKADSLGEYHLLLNEEFKPVLEIYNSDVEKYVNKYTYSREHIDVYRESYFLKNISDSTMSLASLYIDRYLQGFIVSSLKNYFNEWNVSAGKFSVFDTFIYNEKHLPVMAIRKWTPDNRSGIVDTAFINIAYDSIGQIIEYNNILVSNFEEPIKYNFGCAAPFIPQNYYFKYFSNEKKKCKYLFDPNITHNALSHPTECITEIISIPDVKVFEHQDNNNKFYRIITTNKKGEIEVGNSSIKRIDYLPGFNLPKKILVTQGNDIYIYSFSYDTH